MLLCSHLHVTPNILLSLTWLPILLPRYSRQVVLTVSSSLWLYTSYMGRYNLYPEIFCRKIFHIELCKTWQPGRPAALHSFLCSSFLKSHVSTSPSPKHPRLGGHRNTTEGSGWLLLYATLTFLSLCATFLLAVKSYLDRIHPAPFSPRINQSLYFRGK